MENLKNDIRKRRRELAELHDRFATDLERGWEEGREDAYDHVLSLIDKYSECDTPAGSTGDAMSELDEKIKAFGEKHKGVSADRMLAEMRGEMPLGDDLREAAREYSVWNPVEHGVEDADESYDLQKPQHDFIAGAEWYEEKLKSLASEDVWRVINEQYPGASEDEKSMMYNIAVCSILTGASRMKVKMLQKGGAK